MRRWRRGLQTRRRGAAGGGEMTVAAKRVGLGGARVTEGGSI